MISISKEGDDFLIKHSGLNEADAKIIREMRQRLEAKAAEKESATPIADALKGTQPIKAPPGGYTND